MPDCPGFLDDVALHLFQNLGIARVVVLVEVVIGAGGDVDRTVVVAVDDFRLGNTDTGIVVFVLLAAVYEAVGIQIDRGRAHAAPEVEAILGRFRRVARPGQIVPGALLRLRGMVAAEASS